MKPSPRSRRAVLGLGAALAAGVAAACGGTASPRPEPPGSTATTAPDADHAAGLPGELVAGPRNRPRVALTFHGSGDPALTARALEVLRAGGARVTVLAVGRWLEAHPALAGQITGAGHELGNHTYTHPTLPELGAAAVRAEIDDCRDVLIAMAGSPGRWFRPSGTPRASALIRRQAAAAGYPVCLAYDVDPADYADPGPALVRSRVAAAVRPGSIVSLHLGHAGTVAALPGILADLRSRGLAPVTVSDLVGAR
jgi:peptidoglycan/xylan/chitin deacetylase (PgdA/CDA1 family)